MNYNEDEAVIEKKFDPNQAWRCVATSTRSKFQATNDQKQTNKVKQPTYKPQQQANKGRHPLPSIE